MHVQPSLQQQFSIGVQQQPFAVLVRLVGQRWRRRGPGTNGPASAERPSPKLLPPPVVPQHLEPWTARLAQNLWQSPQPSYQAWKFSDGEDSYGFLRRRPAGTTAVDEFAFFCNGLVLDGSQRVCIHCSHVAQPQLVTAVAVLRLNARVV